MLFPWNLKGFLLGEGRPLACAGMEGVRTIGSEVCFAEFLGGTWDLAEWGKLRFHHMLWGSWCLTDCCFFLFCSSLYSFTRITYVSLVKL